MVKGSLLERRTEWRGVTGGDHTFWVRGYCAGAVDLNETVIENDIRNQKESSKAK